jgi:hypothetical protein
MYRFILILILAFTACQAPEIELTTKSHVVVYPIDCDNVTLSILTFDGTSEIIDSMYFEVPKTKTYHFDQPFKAILQVRGDSFHFEGSSQGKPFSVRYGGDINYILENKRVWQ